LAEETPKIVGNVNSNIQPSNAKAITKVTVDQKFGETNRREKLHILLVGVEAWKNNFGVGKSNLKKNKIRTLKFGELIYGSVFKKYHETGIFDENEIFTHM